MKQAAGRYHFAPSRRRWGQNFLRDRQAAERIVEAIGPRSGDFFLEIGPGEGVLTEGLARQAAGVVAVEIDPLMASILAEGLARRCPGLQVIQGDALEVGPEVVWEKLGRQPGDGRRLRLAGNLPFNVSVPLVRHWLGHLGQVADMTFMVQREVAERMLARPATTAYGFLSLAVQLACIVRPLLEVKREAFRPKPNVDAMVVRLDPRDRPAVAEERQPWLMEVVSLAFRSRRKTLFNNLRAAPRFAGAETELTAVFQRLGLDRKRRGETLGLEEFTALAGELATVADRDRSA